MGTKLLAENASLSTPLLEIPVKWQNNKSDEHRYCPRPQGPPWVTPLSMHLSAPHRCTAHSSCIALLSRMKLGQKSLLIIGYGRTDPNTVGKVLSSTEETRTILQRRWDSPWLRMTDRPQIDSIPSPTGYPITYIHIKQTDAVVVW